MRKKQKKTCFTAEIAQKTCVLLFFFVLLQRILRESSQKNHFPTKNKIYNRLIISTLQT